MNRGSLAVARETGEILGFMEHVAHLFSLDGAAEDERITGEKAEGSCRNLDPSSNSPNANFTIRLLIDRHSHLSPTRLASGEKDAIRQATTRTEKGHQDRYPDWPTIGCC